MRMARIPDGAELIQSATILAPGFKIGNVIVMAGVPSIMQAMMDIVAPKLKSGVRMLSESVRANAREGDIGGPLRDIANAHPDTVIGSYPFQDEDKKPNTNLVVRSRDPDKLNAAMNAVKEMLAGLNVVRSSGHSKAEREQRRGQNRSGRSSWLSGRCRRATMAEHPELSAQERADKAFPVSWDQFHRDCRALTWRLNEVGPFHAVIAITRGGLVPAAIVARELGIRVIDTVCVASYDHTKHGDLQVLKGVSAEVAKLGGGTGKGLLIVDDLVDTGKTGRLVRAMLPDAHFATVYAKPLGRPLVDTYITEVSQDTWIHFPWDTALSYQPPIRDGGVMLLTSPRVRGEVGLCAQREIRVRGTLRESDALRRPSPRPSPRKRGEGEVRCPCKTASRPPATSSPPRIAACSPATAASSTIPPPKP